eukprot:gene16188-18476_t
MAFADALKIEIGKDNHVGLLKSRSAVEGIYTLDLDGNVTIKVCTFNVSNGKCGIWRASLSDNDMLNHIEEGVGIFDPEGLPAYAAYFRDALVAGASMDFSLSEDGEVGDVFFVLQYIIGTSRLEGRIRVLPVQTELSGDVYSMLKLSYHFDPLRKISTGTRNTLTIRNNARILEAASEHAGDSAYNVPGAGAEGPEATESAASSSAAAAARAAKKRRVGGVNIFPGMRKKKPCPL